MKKLILALIVLVGISTAGFAASQSGWIGTDWITSGTLIQSQPLKSNLDWLQENKVHKPFDCTGDSERLTWKNGEWQCEEYVIPTVPTTPPNNCVFNGATVRDGESISAYETDSVPYGQTCNSQERRCTDGVFSGSYTNSSCVTAGPGQCSFAGETLNHGAQRVAYQNATVPFGSTCASETRICSDGTLSGSYTNNGCVVDAATTCTFGGSTVNHGAAVTAYENSSVIRPAVCVSENRGCTNGILDGSFVNTACEVTEPERVIRAGCFVDTQEWDVPTAGGCFESGACTETDSVSWSVGDYQRNTAQGLSSYEFFDTSKYKVQWTGSCTGTGTFCTTFGLSNGTHSATAKVTRVSNGEVVFSQSISARKQTSGSCGGNNPLQ